METETGLWLAWMLSFVGIQVYTWKTGGPQATLSGHVKRYVPKVGIIVGMIAGMLHWLGIF